MRLNVVSGRWFAALGVCGVLVLVVIAVTWRPVQVAYHLRALEKASEDSRKMFSSPEPVGDGVVAYVDASNSTERFEYHRDKLVKLGYLTYREYVFETVQLPRDEWKALARQIEVAFPGRVDMYWELSMPGEPLRLQVWDRPDRMRAWSEFAQRFDTPDFRKQLIKTTNVVAEDATRNSQPSQRP